MIQKMVKYYPSHGDHPSKTNRLKDWLKRILNEILELEIVIGQSVDLSVAYIQHP